MKTPELCLIAVQETGYALQYVPEDMKTPELCLIAVQKNGWMLQCVPEHVQTDEIIAAALQNNPDAIQFVKKRLTIHTGTLNKRQRMHIIHSNWDTMRTLQFKMVS
jgi:hypothetical protein